MAFCDQLLSFSIMISRFIPVVMCIMTSFLFIVKSQSMGQTHLILLTHSPVHGHLHCLCFLAIINNPAMNICVQDFVWTYVFVPLQGIPGNGIAESYGNSI